MVNQNKNFLSVGVDIEEVNRFSNLDRIQDKNFLDKIFTDRELDYCFSKDNPAPHLAGRYVGKEAAVKALSAAGFDKISYRKIEIILDDKGIPEIVMPFDKVSGKISLSHCEDKALAVVIVTAKNVKKTNKR